MSRVVWTSEDSVWPWYLWTMAAAAALIFLGANGYIAWFERTQRRAIRA
jgi:hypothetical protein